MSLHEKTNKPQPSAEDRKTEDQSKRDRVKPESGQVETQPSRTESALYEYWFRRSR